MIIRMALFRGALSVENRPAFIEHLETRMLPLIHDFPRISSVSALFPVSSDPALDDVQLILDMRYVDAGAMEAALASPQRSQNAEETKTLLAFMTNPSVEHIVLNN
ncbi:hypothetical protein [Celeribacter sp.]|uniref:hypothetical protein n=1 Tax=Celeribacter sp. TaxID=1890673 RepID=UPI003A91E3EB